MYTCIHTRYIHINKFNQTNNTHLLRSLSRANYIILHIMCIYIHTCIYIYIERERYTHTRIHISIYVCVYVYIHIYIYIYIYLFAAWASQNT